MIARIAPGLSSLCRRLCIDYVASVPVHAADPKFDARLFSPHFAHLQADAVVPEWDPTLMAAVDEEAEAALRDCRVFASPALKEA